MLCNEGKLFTIPIWKICCFVYIDYYNYYLNLSLKCLLSELFSDSWSVKSRPNDRNKPTQYIATLLGATCCVHLATVLRCVATCWVLLAQVWKWSNLSQEYPTRRKTVANCTQHFAPNNVALACYDRLAGAERACVKKWYLINVLARWLLFLVRVWRTQRCPPSLRCFAIFSELIACDSDCHMGCSRSFPICPLPLFQNEASGKAFQGEMSLICMEWMWREWR